LVLQPSVIVADEALNGLDMAMRAQILNLFLDLQDEMNISFVYVSQHLGVVKHICDQILVMHEGKVVESGPTETILQSPQAKITKKLVESHFAATRVNTHKKL
ncbi:MAG: peptide ABC transporter ATP-binding protein, partial [Vibrio sp.]